jgi:DNA-binding MarR family transcriptional regulator
MPLLGYDGFSITDQGVKGIKSGGKGTPRYSLTPVGSTKLDEGEISGNQGVVAASIDEDVTGTRTIREISKHTGLPESTIKSLVKKLRNEGLVRQAAGEG